MIKKVKSLIFGKGNNEGKESAVNLSGKNDMQVFANDVCIVCKKNEFGYSIIGSRRAAIKNLYEEKLIIYESNNLGTAVDLNDVGYGYEGRPSLVGKLLGSKKNKSWHVVPFYVYGRLNSPACKKVFDAHDGSGVITMEDFIRFGDCVNELESAKVVEKKTVV